MTTLTNGSWQGRAQALGWIIPSWDAPANVHAVSTTRHGGVSQPPYDSMNPGDHVGDDGLAVAVNRQRIGEILQLPTEPLWLQQVHGTDVVPMDVRSCYPQADASFANRPGMVSVVMTADCLPVLFCDRQGTKVAAAHAGWRGLCGGVLEQTLAAMACPAEDVLAWLGPAIGPQRFEVGDEVRIAFTGHDPQAAVAFRQGEVEGKWWADIYQLARQRLQAAGVATVTGGDYCTVSQPELFFSYRRDGRTGRMASLIWLS